MYAEIQRLLLTLIWSNKIFTETQEIGTIFKMNIVTAQFLRSIRPRVYIEVIAVKLKIAVKLSKF